MILKQFETQKYCQTVILPTDMRQNEITVPRTPNRSIVVKFLKNCFFLTWKLSCHMNMKLYKRNKIWINKETEKDDNHILTRALKMIGGSK